MAHVTRAAAWATKSTAPMGLAVSNTGIVSAQGSGGIAATLTASVEMVLCTVVSPHASQGTAPVQHPPRVFPYRGRPVPHQMAAVEAQTSTLAMWSMGAVATRMGNVESYQWIAVQAGKSILSHS